MPLHTESDVLCVVQICLFSTLHNVQCFQGEIRWPSRAIFKFGNTILTKTKQALSRDTRKSHAKEQPHTLYTGTFLVLRYLTGCARAENRPVAVKITSEISAKSE